MRKNKLNKTGKVAIKTLVISFVLIVFSRIIIELLFKVDLNDRLEEAIYSTFYFIIFASIFLFVLSLIILIIQILRRLKNTEV